MNNIALVHDWFNVIFFSLLICLSVYRFICGSETLCLFLHLITLLYMILDNIYIIYFLNNTRAKVMLSIHHITTILLILVPLYWRELHIYFYLQILVEFNAIFLMLRRLLNFEWIEKIFIWSWYIIRIFLYTILFFHYWHIAFKYNIIKYIIPACLQTIMMGINCIWHYNIFIKKKKTLN